MNKKLLISIGSLVILAVGYWLLSPFLRNVSLNEGLPGIINTTMIKDNLNTMDADKKVDFKKQTLEMKDKMLKMGDIMPVNEPRVLSRGEMVARAHEVAGSALIVKTGNETFLRFENLKTINGPDLRIYLSSNLSSDDIVDLGPIRATEGNVNYTIPTGTDLNKYKNVMIWCRAFGVLFSYAEINL